MLGRRRLCQLARGSGLGCLRGLASQPAEAAAAASAPALPPFNYTPPPYAGPSKEEVLATRRQFLSPGAPGRPLAS